MKTALRKVRAGWNRAARENAIANILTDMVPRTEEEFYLRGQDEIRGVMDNLGGLGRERALDFGCGIGRLTVALADHFEAVDGVDISGEMVKRARRHERVTYHVTDSLSGFEDESFDFVYSMIVLQHMPVDLQAGYVKDFIRLIRPDGVAVFQVSDKDFDHPDPWLSMYGVPRVTIEGWVTDAGGKLLPGEYVAVKA